MELLKYKTLLPFDSLKPSVETGYKKVVLMHDKARGISVLYSDLF